MPPKVKITKEEIIHTAVDIVRQNGAQAINARSIAAAMNCSTQPVFSNFTTMEQLQKAVEVAAYERYLGFLQKDAESGVYPKYKAFGMAYIRFAKEEKELFKMLFMCDREGKEPISTVDTETSVAMLMKANGFTREKAELIHLEMWVFVHGIATMFATSFWTLEWELVSSMVTDIYQGIRARHLAEEEKNECN